MYLIIETTQYGCKRTVYSANSYREAMIWVSQNYTDEEYEKLQVTIRRTTAN